MEKRPSRITALLREHLWLLLFVSALLVSVLARVVWPPERVERTLFFPGTTTDALSGEVRLLPRPRSLEHDISNVARDLLLGPAGIWHSRALPRTASVQSVVIVDQRLFLDLSREVLFTSQEVRVNLQIGLAAMEKTLRFNFRQLEEITVTIGGRLPYQSPYNQNVDGVRGQENKVVDKENRDAIISDKVLLLA